MCSTCRSRSRFMICACTDTSSADTGSSSTISDGSTLSALAIAMRCRCPPLNSCGKRSACSGRSPTSFSSSITRSRASLPLTFLLTTSGSAMMSRTRIRGLSELHGSWKTACTCIRNCRRSCPLSEWMSCPSIEMEPPVGCSRRSTSLAVVVLPQPDSPTSASVCPRRTSKLMPSTARTQPTVFISTSPSVTGKCFWRFSALTRTSATSPPSASRQRCVRWSQRTPPGTPHCTCRGRACSAPRTGSPAAARTARAAALLSP